MTSGTPISRRRFLAVIGGAGITTVAGWGSWRLLTDSRPTPTLDGDLREIEPSVEIVEVQPGFTDATVWRGQLFTLRAGSDNGSVTLRSETIGTDHTVHTPHGFTARCLGVIEDSIAVGGHQLVMTETVSFDHGTDYESLLASAGAESQRLRDQPWRATASRHRHQFSERLPMLIASEELISWSQDSFRSEDEFGGAVGAFVGGNSTIAIDRYVFADSPDSLFQVEVGDIEQLLVRNGDVEVITVNHGGIWGTCHDGSGPILVIGDTLGTVGYEANGLQRFKISPDESLLGAHAGSHGLHVDVLSADGRRLVRYFEDGEAIGIREKLAESPIVHQLDSGLAVVSSWN